MRLLIITQYFPPEVGAPQNRLHDLAVRLKKKGVEVTVLTAMPNYPQMEIHKGYRGKWSVRENIDGLDVRRTWIFVSKSKGIFKRLLNYYSFVFSSFIYGLFCIGKHDYIFVESPPLFLGKSAWLLSVLKRSKMIFNVSDLWPESAEKLGLVTNKLFLGLAYRLEAFLYKRSFFITGQTQGIVKDISRRFPQKKVQWLPNGIDLAFFKHSILQDRSWRKKNNFSDSDFILLYAGIIGYAQGLDVIIRAAARLKQYPSVKFILLGSGPEKERLLELKEELSAYNVIFVDTVAKSEMPLVISASDAAVVPLRKLELFKGAIPSKIFENLGMKRPVVLGVEGEAKELFIDEGKAGIFYEPENDEQLAAAVIELFGNKELREQLGENGFRYVSEKFNRETIADNFYSWLSEGN